MLDMRVKTFLTLYEEMNYSKTAARLNMTQPGVSQHIRKLEEHYGVRLFTYEGRTLRRTREAEILKRHLDSILVEESSIYREFHRTEGVHLRVGATKTIGEFVLVPAVEKFLAHPLHSLEYMIDNTETLLPKLESGELDFAVIEGVFDRSRYGWELYRKEEFVGICSRNHRFAGRRITMEELFRETILVREIGSGTRKLLEQALSDRGYSLENFRRVIALGNFSVIIELLIAGLGVTFAYMPIVEQRDALTTFSVNDCTIEGEFNFVWCNESIARSSIKEFFSDSIV